MLVKINKGKLLFQPMILNKNEFLLTEQEATFNMVDGSLKTLKLEKGTLAFTVCQVPVIYKIATSNQMELYYDNGSEEVIDSLELDLQKSTKIFQRTGEIGLVIVSIKEDYFLQ